MAPSTSTAPVVEPVLDHAAAERARLVNEARADLLRGGGAVTIDMMATATGRTPPAVRQWVTRQRAAGTLVTVLHDGIVLIPTFQLDDAFALDPSASAVVQRLVDHGMSGWAVWDWFATPNTWLDGRTPAAVLKAGGAGDEFAGADEGGDEAGVVAAVHAAVTGLFQE